MYLEGSDAINFVAKEIDSIREFMREGIDIDDASSNGKLPRFVNIISPDYVVGIDRIASSQEDKESAE